RIGREIAPYAVVPMNVLQAALAIVGRSDAEQSTQPFGPSAGKVRRHEIARDHRAFEAVAQNYVSGIGDLIGIDPDQAPLDADLSLVERLGVPAGPVAAKSLAQDRRGKGQESAAAANLHLQQQGLALVNRHATGATDRLQAPCDG